MLTARVPYRLALAGAAVLVSGWRVQDMVTPLATMHLTSVLTAAMLASTLLDRGMLARLGASLRHPLMRVVCLLALFAMLSVPTSLWFGLSLEFLIKNLAPGILLALVVASATVQPDDARRLAATFLAGGAFYCGMVLVRFHVGTDGRLGNLVYYDANDLGMLITCTLPIACGFLIASRSTLARAASAVSAVLLLATLVRTGSRGAFLGLLAVSAVLLMTMRPVRPAVRGAVTLVAALAFVASAGDRYWTSMSTLLHPTADYNWVGNEDGGRMSVWTRGLGYMRDHPVFGVGLGAFQVAEGTLSPLAARQEFGASLKWSAAHNSAVQIGAELGVGGLWCFLALIAGAMRATGRLAATARRREQVLGAGPDASGALPEADIEVLAVALRASVVGYAVTGFFLSQAYATPWFLLLGLTVGLEASAVAAWGATVPKFTLLPVIAQTPRRALPAAPLPHG